VKVNFLKLLSRFAVYCNMFRVSLFLVTLYVIYCAVCISYIARLHDLDICPFDPKMLVPFTFITCIATSGIDSGILLPVKNPYEVAPFSMLRNISFFILTTGITAHIYKSLKSPLFGIRLHLPFFHWLQPTN